MVLPNTNHITQGIKDSKFLIKAKESVELQLEQAVSGSGH